MSGRLSFFFGRRWIFWQKETLSLLGSHFSPEQLFETLKDLLMGHHCLLSSSL